MKKALWVLAFLTLGMGASAQEEEIPVRKTVITNNFWSNWFVTGGVEFNAAYTSEEDLKNKNPFSVDRGTFGFNVGFGKWLTPIVGLRTKFQGAWSKQVMTGECHPSYGYWNLHEDFLFNASNFFRGYKEDRCWNLIPYVGFGVARNMTANVNELSFNAGLLNNFRINSHFSVFVDLSYHGMDGGFDAAPYDGWASHGKFAMRHADKMLGLSVGVTYHIGKSKWSKAPDIEALMEMNREQLDAMNSSLEDQQNENRRLRELLSKEEPKEIVKYEPSLVSTSHSIFFNIGSARIANRKDLIDLKEIAVYAKQFVQEVIVTGYADSKTGRKEYNQRLSEARAEAVADELVKMGVDRKAIRVEGRGGVDDIAPFSYNRRVIVKIGAQQED